MGAYNTMFIAGLIIAIVGLLLTVVLFFVLKIPKALGVVTGSAQKKAIEEIRAHGYESQAKKGQGARERIHVRDAEMDTGALGKSGTGEISVREAEMDTGKAPSRRGRGRVGKNLSLENEETEILGNESGLSGEYGMGRGPSDRSLEEGETDVLGASSSSMETEAETDVLNGDRPSGNQFGAAYEDETDVLSGNGGAARPTVNRYEEEETDVLSSGRRDMSGQGGFEDEAEETDVLTSGMNSTPADEEIIGRYSAEETAVLRSMHSTQDDFVFAEKGIRTLYSETIVHTEETLYGDNRHKINLSK